MERLAARRLDRRDGGFDIAAETEIVRMQMQRMGETEVHHRLLQRLDDRARADIVIGHDIVEREGADIVLERHRRAGIDAFDADAFRDIERRRDIIGNGGGAGPVADHREKKIVIAEHGQDRLVDDRHVGEFEMRMQSVMRHHRRLDDHGEAHRRIAAAGLEGGPAGRRERRLGRTRPVGAMIFRQQKARRVHIAAGDVRMNVDRAGHHDLAGHVINRIGALALPPVRRCDRL